MDMFWKQLPCYGFLIADTVKVLLPLNWIAAFLLLHSQEDALTKFILCRHKNVWMVVFLGGMYHV